MRKLQRYSVNVRRHCLDRLIVQGDVTILPFGLYAQENDLLYDQKLGFLGCADDVQLAAGNFIV
jgi:hypothetical protein